MEQIRAFKSLNKAIYATPEEAQAADKKWITQKLEDDLTKFFQNSQRVNEVIARMAAERTQIRQMIELYDEMEKDAVSGE